MRIFKTLKSENKGMVAIMVAVFLVLIISLVVVNYSQLVRREQRQTLDRQLNTQALYVAESGVNHLAKLARENPSFTGKTTCENVEVTVGGEDTNISLGTDLEVTCSLVDSTPTSLTYNGLDSSSKVIPIKSADGSNIREIGFTWHNSEGAFSVADCDFPNFRPNTLSSSPPDGCTPGVLKIDLVNTESLDSNAILGNTFTSYFYPSSGGTNTVGVTDASGPGNQGRIVQTDCSSGICSMTITDLNSNSYHMRVSYPYNTSANLNIEALDSSDESIELIGAQAEIDVTARAVDVIRRIKTRVPTSPYLDSDESSFSSPDAALQVADDICKQYSVIPGDSVTGCEL
ncbi:MAG: hypothetical protein U5L95_05505 [Candidatus Saccharibacteria bacterium]|nr:hypothetical protein [Candidatus Saccharibacteria bacterium]